MEGLGRFGDALAECYRVARATKLGGSDVSLENEKECGEVLRLIAAARGAMDSLMAEVLEGHIREHATTERRSPREATAAADDVIELVRAYLK
jgi:DNA-binding FrmR family transcriptional regulator